MNKLNSFAKQVVAIIKGDDAEVKAQKIWRQADSALKVQIANLKGDIITKEDAVERAQEMLAKALVNNGNEITDRKAYVQGMIDAKANLVRAEKELKAMNDTIAFLEEQYKELSAE